MIDILKSQQENIQSLLELIKENPGLKILPLVETDCVPDDGYCSWVNQWGTAEIEEVWHPEGAERIYIKSDDFEGLVEELYSKSDYSEEYTEKIVNSYDWQKVILVRIVPERE